MSTQSQEGADKPHYYSMGDAIKHLRKQVGLTQVELAIRVGVKQPTVCQYEKNAITPPIKVMRLLSRELNVSIDFLAKLKGSQPVKL